jgi:hypothetical protein
MVIIKRKIKRKEVTWQKGTNSIYFRDPAGNLVESLLLDLGQ